MTIAQGASVTSPSIWNEEAVDAGEEGDDVVEQADLRLVEERPEIADDGRRQHHRQQDDRGPEAVAAEFLVDQPGEAEAKHGLDDDGPEHEMRRHLHRRPDIRIGQDRLVPIDPEPT